MIENIGFIGYGNIGSMIARGFLKLGIFNPGNVYIFEPDKRKYEQTIQKWPEVVICKSNTELAKACDSIFVCEKPYDAAHIYREIKNVLNGETHIVSVAAGLTIENIEKIYHGKITRVIPSYVSEIYEGVSLICHNEKVSVAEAKNMEKILNEISTVKRIKEADFEVATDLTSCGPGFIAYIFDEFVKTAIKHSSLSQEEAEEMVIITLFGTAKLLYDKNIGFQEVIEKVATKGGITEEGVNIMKTSIPQIMEELFVKTLDKIHKTKNQTNEQFSS